MENIKYKILAYAKANGVNSVNFQTEVIINKPSDGDVKIDAWNLSIAEPTFEQLNALETEATAIETAEANEVQAKIDLKTSAKAKLIAGEALTAAEADTIVL
jgi:hypothetical protein